GDWKGATSMNRMTITNSGSVTEAFDEAEVKGFTSPAGLAYPSLLSVQMAWETGKQNEAFARDKLYSNALVLTVSGASINLGSPGLRKEIYKPVNTVDWSKLKTSPLVNTSSSAVIVQKASVASPASFSTAAAGMRQINTAPTVSVVQSPSFGKVISVPSHVIVWNREAIMIQDYNLLKAFAQKVLAFEKNYQQLERTLSAGALEDDNSPQLYTSNAIGGFAYVPLNKLGALYRSPVNMKIIRSLASQPYEYLPKTGNRNIQFVYGLKGFVPTTLTKTINY
ncbi:MAG TPA: hypothetical protein VGD17_05665, partial [Chitinophagaceae bacterium]